MRVDWQVKFEWWRVWSIYIPTQNITDKLWRRLANNHNSNNNIRANCTRTHTHAKSLFGWTFIFDGTCRELPWPFMQSFFFRSFIRSLFYGCWGWDNRNQQKNKHQENNGVQPKMPTNSLTDMLLYLYPIFTYMYPLFCNFQIDIPICTLTKNECYTCLDAWFHNTVSVWLLFFRWILAFEFSMRNTAHI